MRTRDRLGLGLVLLLSLALGIWWLFYVPYAPVRLYRAIPAHAAAVSAHRDLPRRWEDLAANPVMRSLFRSLGADPDEAGAVTQDPVLAALLEQLAGRDLVLGYVPSLGPQRLPAWVASSWIGGKSNHLQWLAPLLEIEGLTRGRSRGGHALWVPDEEAFAEGPQPSVALLEGMLVWCLSSDPGAIQAVLDCCDGTRPSIATALGKTEQVRWLLESEDPDRGWVLPGALAQGMGEAGERPVFFAFEAFTATRIRGRLERSFALAPGTPPGGEPLAGADLEQLFGDLPLVVMTLRRDLAERGLAEWPSPWAGTAEQALADMDVPHVAAGLLGGAFSGRLKGIRVPSLVLALQTDDEEAGLRAMHAALDLLNAEYQLGAIPKAQHSGAGRLYRIDASTEHAYGRLADGEQAGYAFAGQWMVLCSSSGVLEQLLLRYHAGRGSEAAAAPWRAATDEADAASCWLNLEEGGKTAKLALTAYSLKLLFSGPDQIGETLAAINEAKAWIDALSSLKRGRLALHEKEGGRAQMTFDVGP